MSLMFVSPLRHVRLLLVIAALLPAAAGAAVEVGDAVPAVRLEDQHGQPLTIPPTARLVLFAADKAASDLIAEALAGQPGDLLARRQAVYLADISAMPALVTRLFALPAMRALAFPIGLARDASLAELPRRRGAVTRLTLVDGRISGVDYLADVAQIQQAVGLR